MMGMEMLLGIPEYTSIIVVLGLNYFLTSMEKQLILINQVIQFLYQVMELKLPLELLVMTGLQVMLGIPKYIQYK